MTEPGPATPQPAQTAPPLLEARELTKHFLVHRRRRQGRTVHAVEQVSLSLAADGITAVVGESGSGKSTLARMLARLITPTSGQILLGGKPVPASTRGRRAYTRDVQMVLQDPFSSLNPVHDIRYHLSRPLLVHGIARRGPGLDLALASLLDTVALTPPDRFLSKYPHELSGGQRQRVAIARALAPRPRVLLADEPVSMLDVSIRLGILNLLAELRRDSDLAILYITHDIASARYLADTIMVMYAGQRVESGPATTVTDEPAHPYTKLLLTAAPDPDRATPPVIASRGTPPSLVNPPGGCRFHPRCPYAMAVCSERVPPDFEVSAGHPVPAPAQEPALAPGHGPSRPRHPVPAPSHEPTLAPGYDASRPRHLSACWLHATGLTAAESRPLAGRGADLVSSHTAPEQGKET